MISIGNCKNDHFAELSLASQTLEKLRSFATLEYAGKTMLITISCTLIGHITGADLGGVRGVRSNPLNWNH